MISALYDIILAIPVMNERSPLEPFLYTAACIVFPVALLFFLKRNEDKGTHS